MPVFDDCPCGIAHVILDEAEAERVRRLIEATEPREVTGDNGVRVIVPPIALVLHGEDHPGG
jgi:hypothetical protein